MPTITLFPSLYLLGWIAAQPLQLCWANLQREQLDLIGTLISFLLFLSLLPSWVKSRWRSSRPWQVLGLIGGDQVVALKFCLRGLVWAFGLLLLVVVPVLSGPWGSWLGSFSGRGLLNALLLGFGAGFAEELIFRSWLWGELNQLIGPRWGFFTQSLVFSFVHIRLDFGFYPMLGLLVGLFLLGLALALRRRLDGGSLWGCVALHGGLVGGWFFLSDGLIEVSLNAPGWLVGPGGLSPNPLGGALAILGLMALLWTQFNAVAIAPRP